jgi:hypothetical protein
MAQTFKYTVVGDTQPAVKGNEALDASINKVDASTKKLQTDLGKTSVESNKAFGAELENKIKASDAQIKRISGTVGLLTGTLSTAVGALGLLGVDDEQIKGFQQATLSVLALGSGAAQAITGIKDITESRKLLTELNNTSTASEIANTNALVSNAAAAETVTVAQNTAAGSILTEKTATDKNTISKGLNSAATTTNTVATEKLTFAKRAQLLIDQALLKIQQISLGGWLAIAIAIGTAVTVIGNWISSTKELASEEEELNQFLVQNVKLTKEQTSTYATSISRLKVLQAIISDTTQSEKDRKLALQELQKLIPDLEKVDLRRADAIDKIRIAIGREIAALEQRAKAQAIQQKLTEAYTRQLELIGEVQDEFARQGFQISEFEARVALEREGQVGVTGQLAQEYQKLNRQIDTGTASLVSYASATVSSNGASSKSVEITKQQTIALDFYNTALKKANEEQSKRNKELAEEVRLSLGIDDIGARTSEGFIKRASTIPSLAETTANETKKTYATQALEFQAFVENLQGNLIDFIESGAGQAIQQGLSTLSGLLSEFGNLQQEAIDIELGALERRYQRELQLIDAKAKAELLTAEEVARLKEGITLGYEKRELEIAKTSLEKQKKLRRAQVIVTTAQSVIDAYSSTANIPPPFGLIAGSLLAASYIGLGSKAIANINATSLDGSDAPGGFNNIPAGGGAFSLPGGGGVSTTPSTGAILPGLGGGRVAGAPTIGTISQEPIRAYVLAGDVTNGVQANIALNNRRRLAG